MKKLLSLLALVPVLVFGQTFPMYNATVANEFVWDGYFSSINYSSVSSAVSTLTSGGTLHIPYATNPTLPAQLGILSLEYDGPATPVDVYSIGDQLGRSDHTFKGQNKGGHSGLQGYQVDIIDEPIGTGSNLAQSGDAALGLTTIKQGYPSTMSVVGQVAGLNIAVRGGYSGTYGLGKGDVSAIDTNVVIASGSGQPAGFAASMENVTYIANNAGSITSGMDTQIGAMDGNSGSSIGYYANALQGTLSSAFTSGATGAGASWGNILENVNNGGNVNFSINGNGAITQYPNSYTNSNAIIYQNNAGTWQLLNNSSASMATINQAGMFSSNDYPQGATSYSPTMAPGSGSFTNTVNAAYYIQRGSMVYVDIYYTMSATSSGSGVMNVTVPLPLDSKFIVGGNGLTGATAGASKMMFVAYTGVSGNVSFSVYDGSSPCSVLGAGHLSFYYLSTTL